MKTPAEVAALISAQFISEAGSRGLKTIAAQAIRERDAEILKAVRLRIVERLDRPREPGTLPTAISVSASVALVLEDLGAELAAQHSPTVAEDR